MPRNGSGTYSLPAGNPVVSGTVIASSGWGNPTMSDIASALTNSIAKDGQTVPTANLPMGNFAHTGVSAATARTQYARAAEVQDGTIVYLATVAGTNTITASASLGMTAYATGQTFRFIPANTNTGATTINLNSIGALNVFYNGAACVGGELVATVPAEILYDGTRFHLIGNAASREVLISSQSASASPNIAFTDLSSTFGRYRVYLENVKPATDDDSFALVVGTGGGPTYQTGGGAYTWGLTTIGVSGAAEDGSTTSGVSTSIRMNRTGAANGVGNGAGENLSMVVDFTNPASTDRIMFTFTGSLIRADGVAQHVFGGGSYAASVGPITAIRFNFVSGNIASGALKLYGIR